VEFILGCQHFASIGGTQTYLLTVAEQLQRLGHAVTVVTEQRGDMAELAERRGCDVVLASAAPVRCDGILTRDGVMASELAAAYPGVPHLFVAPSEYFDFQLPPPVVDAVSTAIALSDRIEDRLRALAVELPVVRLTHPVDVRRFSPRAPLRTPPRRLLMLGNYLRGDRRGLVTGVCDDLGIEWVQIGAHGSLATTDPVAEIGAADIVVGKARAIVEAMACGRAAYVMDAFGTDGWVTPDRYAALEADNFAGRTERTALTAERLRDDLLAYRPAMGVANRDLAIAGHSAGRHAEALVAEWRRAGARPAASPSELERVGQLERLLARTEGELGLLQTDVTLAHERSQQLETENDAWAARTHTAEGRLAAVRASRRYRFSAALVAPFDRLRRRGRTG
jgi:hypothetical protein